MNVVWGCLSLVPYSILGPKLGEAQLRDKFAIKCKGKSKGRQRNCLIWGTEPGGAILGIRNVGLGQDKAQFRNRFKGAFANFRFGPGEPHFEINYKESVQCWCLGHQNEASEEGG